MRIRICDSKKSWKFGIFDYKESGGFELVILKIYKE